jgi:anti-sigma-K factor RskA
MKYDDPQLQDVLAGEYALGSLHGAARARFETLMRQNPALRRRVVEWQERLTPLAEETGEVPPPSRVLTALRRRIKPAHAPVRWWNRLDFWRPFGALATSLALVLAIYLGVQLTQPPASTPLDPRYVAVLADSAQKPAVVVTAFANPFRVTVEAVQPVTVATGNVLRIWAVDKTTGARQRLVDFAPGAAQRFALDEQHWALVKSAASLEVHEEPAALAATEPNGPALYTGACINLKGVKTS